MDYIKCDVCDQMFDEAEAEVVVETDVHEGFTITTEYFICPHCGAKIINYSRECEIDAFYSDEN